MKFKLALAASAACLALSACNSSNGSSGALTSAEAQNTDATYTDYQDRIDNGTLTTTEPTGQASMSGYMGISDVDPEDSSTTVLGKLAMDVDFDAGTVSGTGSNFGIYSGETLTKESGVTGTLDVAGTVSGSSLTANASGDLQAPGDSSTTNFDLDMTGSFYDDAGTLTTVGDLSGMMSPPGEDTRTVGGGFYATEN